MNYINVGGKRMKIVRFKDNLYRADPSSFMPGYRASNDYKGAEIKYFTLDKSELSAYTKYGKPYMKTWSTLEDLILIDILDLNTRKALEDMFLKENNKNVVKSINIAFPIKNNKVLRVSEEHTAEDDNTVLKAICNLGIFDGYYMKRLMNNNRYIFHSEVGLCPKAYNKLELMSVDKNMYQPPRINRATKKRRFNINTKNNTNTIRNNTIRNTKNAPVRSYGRIKLFDNTNNNSSIRRNTVRKMKMNVNDNNNMIMSPPKMRRMMFN